RIRHTDTASIVCTFVVSYLAEYPHVYKRVLQVMRIVPPISGTFREAIDHFSFKGFYIPKGWRLRFGHPEFTNVATSLGSERYPSTASAINSDYRDGHKVPSNPLQRSSSKRIRRKKMIGPEFVRRYDMRLLQRSGPQPYSYIPFGGGPRMCPGKEYARLEILIYIHYFVKRFKWDKCFQKKIN
ncbi:hypothetical protein EUTSA_v10028112mg, partial [Eutrema salsugineum]